MVERFTRSGHAIVTVTTTLRSDVRVIEVRRNPTGGTMAIIALRRGRQMVEILTHGRNAIVTAVTGAQYLEVIDRDGRIPQVGAMAVLTDIGGADVVE